MTETFKNLDDNKQKRVLTAALKEFGENGFEQASTNRMVKGAGIGKGMLFYYFKNKKELYQYLIDYSLDFTINEYINLIDTAEPDFIERLLQASRIKMKAYTENPALFNFLGTLLLTDESEIPAALKVRIEELQKLGYSKLYENIDRRLFRDDVDVEKAFQLIRWSIEGYQNELTNRLKGQKMASIDFEPYWEEFYEYIEVLKSCFYK
ncbi:TetR/AcrR family transcriptional regulator [Halobacillus shinanisalinarum]|uniref:TetR/AcrR family transcriptional regulator n=1 Tax=Halobacillus shinanisalinarum TaxID=2932258 RepID=A0ABY4GVX5_9BACI|nr:TetR/AcrR family transcriptional regulator [Halobacillus shinanisalinarum]UOQ92121.1 TetR/AcrR family transcriptional regulator [Halobacillus shinanisalinarum]